MDKIDYSSFISSKRRSVSTPKRIVEEGVAHFGTFDKEFEILNILNCKKPTAAPDFLKKMRLTLWEATEVRFPGGYLVAGISDMGLFGVDFDVVYLEESNETLDLSTITARKNVQIAPNLLNGAITRGETSISALEFINHFEKGEAHIRGHHKSKKHSISYDFHLSSISLPSNVSIPFGDNRPLVTEKAFFKADGHIGIDGNHYELDDKSTAIIDDHRAYYPYISHYDWITYMGKDENGRYIAFNLTENQSTNPEEYNENLIWLEGRTSLLPPVSFVKSTKTGRFHDKKEKGLVWHITDEHGMVDLYYEITSTYANRANAFIAKIEYFVTFGKLNGYVLEEDGTKHEFKDVIAVGEDKSLRL